MGRGKHLRYCLIYLKRDDRDRDRSSFVDDFRNAIEHIAVFVD